MSQKYCIKFIPSDVHCRVLDDLRSDADICDLSDLMLQRVRTSLLNEGRSLFYGLSHLETNENDRKATATERRCGQLVENSDAALAANDAHIVAAKVSKAHKQTLCTVSVGGYQSFLAGKDP